MNPSSPKSTLYEVFQLGSLLKIKQLEDHKAFLLQLQSVILHLASYMSTVNAWMKLAAARSIDKALE